MKTKTKISFVDADGKPRVKKRKPPYKQAERDDSDKGCRQAARAVTDNRRLEKLESLHRPLTPEEFRQRRLEEEAETRARLKRLNEEHQAHERMLRLKALKERQPQSTEQTNSTTI
jgi:hypothetical protein